MIMYDYDTNEILYEPIKNRQAVTIRDSFLKFHKVLKTRSQKPKVYIMENKCSRNLKEAMKKYEIDFQQAPPHMHRRNTAERSIELTKTTSYKGSLRQIHIFQYVNGTI